MINFISFINIFLFIYLLNSQQTTFTQINNKQISLPNRQFLVQTENYYLLNFQLNNFLLPQSLVNLYSSWGLNQIEINMGFFNKKGISFHLPIDKGVSILIRNNTELQQNIINQLGQIFLISRNPQFSMYLSQINATYISNPNDKFGSQHLTNLINYFLPCRLNSGISQLFNEKQQFQKNFFGVNILWTKSGIKLKFYIGKQKDVIRKLRSIKYKKGCGMFDETIFLQLNQQQNEIVSHDSKNSIQIDNLNVIQSFTKSNWYGKDKRIITKINLKQNEFKQVYLVKIRCLLPRGFRLFSVQVITNIEKQRPNTKVTKFQTQYQQTMVIIECQNFKKKYFQQIIVSLNLQATFKGFQNYENIAGGGEQFMRIPIFLKLRNNTEVWFNNDPISQHLLEPDFSIPFQTITFTVVIFGYLWIAVWRSLIQQEATKNKKIKQEKLKEE